MKNMMRVAAMCAAMAVSFAGCKLEVRDSMDCPCGQHDGEGADCDGVTLEVGGLKIRCTENGGKQCAGGSCC